jgi:hypothetical protein
MVREAWGSVRKYLVREVALRAAFFLTPERKRALERRLRGKEEFRKLGLADVVVVSFGKSGRTWVRVLVSRFFQLRFGLPESALIGFENFHLKDRRMPRVFFTHDNYLRDYTGNLDNRRDFYDKRTVLLVRHPADVAVSQFFQWKFRMRPRKKGLNEYPEHGAEVGVQDFVLNHEAGLPKVIGFMNAWARELPNVKAAHVLRYEDLRADTAGELGKVLRFMGQEPTDAELADCVAFASVENMRKLEEGRVFWLAGSRMRAKDAQNPNSYKVRRAKVGGWRDYFEDDAQAAAVERMIEEQLLPGFGYLARERQQQQESPQSPAPPQQAAAVPA